MSVRGYIFKVQQVLPTRKVRFVVGIYLFLIVLQLICHGRMDSISSYLFALLRIMLLVVVLGTHGFFRGLYYHPFFNPGYRYWLSYTSWRWDKTLPLGPVHFLLVEWLLIPLVTLLGLTELYFAAQLTFEMPGSFSLDVLFNTFHQMVPSTADWPTDLMIGWLLCCTGCLLLGPYVFMMSLKSQNDKLTGRLLMFLLPLFVIFKNTNPVEIFALLVLMYVIVQWGVARTLSRFPWNYPEYDADPIKRLREDASDAAMTGPLFRALGPVYKHRSVSIGDAFAIGGLLAWWTLVPIRLTMNEHWDKLTQWTPLTEGSVAWGKIVFGWFLIAAFLAFIRFLIYRSGIRPPLTLRARLLTGRFIIPRYDLVYLPLLTILSLGAGMVFIIGPLPIPNVLHFALGLFILLFASMALGPTREKWRLTGQFHTQIYMLELGTDDPFSD